MYMYMLRYGRYCTALKMVKMHLLLKAKMREYYRNV